MVRQMQFDYDQLLSAVLISVQPVTRHHCFGPVRTGHLARHHPMKTTHYHLQVVVNHYDMRCWLSLEAVRPRWHYADREEVSVEETLFGLS